MGYSPGEVRDRNGRLVSFETRAGRHIELSIVGATYKDALWTVLDENEALKLLDFFVIACNSAFKKKFRLTED